ncbi:MAG: CRISPR-associated protein [Leptolyngbyaceae cyanobacterium CSU_1_3]|nr:CRISPR-associated protein [Leptolyngbyaceae cyanobacterium CSU_1_3]
MHKLLVNQCTIELSLIARGPILIKSGSQGADPTKPDMEFVETFHNGKKAIYLPGSSLKGAIRAHAERIVRTVGSEQPSTTKVWANDPIRGNDNHLFDGSGQNRKKKPPAELYKSSSFTEQMFGNTSLSSRVRIEDAYPDKDIPLMIEERNSVAIDRVTGATSGSGLFNYEVCTSGQFTTKIHLKNFSLAQLGLLALVLRDLGEGWFGIGFGKSRGLGTMSIAYKSAIVRYPGCTINEENKIQTFAKNLPPWERTTLLGAGEFLGKNNLYGFPCPDQQPTPAVGAKPMPMNFGVQMQWLGNVQIEEDLFPKSVEQWRKRVCQESAT